MEQNHFLLCVEIIEKYPIFLLSLRTILEYIKKMDLLKPPLANSSRDSISKIINTQNRAVEWFKW
jgi:hypothetical protein